MTYFRLPNIFTILARYNDSIVMLTIIYMQAMIMIVCLAHDEVSFLPSPVRGRVIRYRYHVDGPRITQTLDRFCR
jgi:hypothetical protein